MDKWINKRHAWHLTIKFTHLYVTRLWDISYKPKRTPKLSIVYFLLAIVNDDTCHEELRNIKNFILWHVFLTIMAEPAWHLWHGWIITSKSSMLSIVLQKIVSMPRYQIPAWISDYRKFSDIRLIKPPTLKVSRLGLHLSLRHTLKPNVKWRMKM